MYKNGMGSSNVFLGAAILPIYHSQMRSGGATV